MHGCLSVQYATYDYHENMSDKCHYINNDQCGSYCCLTYKGIVCHRVTKGSLCNIPEASFDTWKKDCICGPQFHLRTAVNVAWCNSCLHVNKF